MLDIFQMFVHNIMFMILLTHRF